MTKVIMPQPVTDTYEIPVSEIVADPKQNTRKNVSDIDKLAASIKYEGQQTPVLVARRPDGKFDLIYGFRRFYAVSWPKDKGGLEMEVIKARVTDAMEPEDRLMTNLIENMAREDLSSFDTAMACKQLEDMTKGDMSGSKIANKVGKSATYVNNLLKAVRVLPSNIMNRWKAEQSETWDEDFKGTKRVLTTDNLNKLSVASFTEDERQLAFKKMTGEISDGEGKGEGAGTGAPAGGIKRASKAALEQALEDVQKMNKKKPDDMLKMVVATLKFALGETTGIGKVWQPMEKEEAA